MRTTTLASSRSRSKKHTLRLSNVISLVTCCCGFGQVEHRIDDDARIARRLIDIGADVNAMSPRGGLVFCEVLWMKHTDEELAPIYDLWFEQPGSLDFTTPAKNGREPLGMARALPYRASILERMERYVAEHS